MATNDIAEALGIPSGPGGLQADDPYPLELPIRVRGLTGGSNLGADAACEPFLEDTLTVLVSPRGAVLRLAAPATPGQMLTVSSPRLGCELPARVVRYRGHANVKGYAEIEFTPETVRAAAGAAVRAAAVTEETPLSRATEMRGQSGSLGPAISPASAMPLTDLLGDMPRSRQGQRNYEAFHPPAPPKRASAPAQRAEPKEKRHAGAESPASAPAAMDLEALLAARRAAEQAAGEIALRLLGPSELAGVAEPRRPRQRRLAVAAAAILLTLGAAGLWAVVTSAPAPGALPEIAAFARPGVPKEFMMRNEVRLRLPVGPRQETESLPIATQLIPPLAPLEPRVAKARPGGTGEASAAPQVRGANFTPGGAARPEALTSLSALGTLSAPPSVPAPPPTGGEVTPPRLLSQTQVVFPQMARMARAEGTVVIDAQVDENGRVGEMRVLSGPAIFHQAAKDSLAQWRYQPAMLNGKAVAIHLYVTIQFRR